MIVKEKGEFLGAVWNGCFDGDFIYGYDHLSNGVFRIRHEQFEVDLVMKPDELFERGISEIRSVLLDDDRMILAPAWTDQAWIVYDLKNERIGEIVYPKPHVRIERVHKMNDCLYSMPIYTDEPICVFDKTLKLIGEIRDWYKGEKTTCLVSTYNGEGIIIPIQHTGSIVRLNSISDYEKIDFEDITDLVLAVGVKGKIFVRHNDNSSIVVFDELSGEYDRIPVVDESGCAVGSSDVIGPFPIENGLLMFSFDGFKVYYWKQGDDSCRQIKVYSGEACKKSGLSCSGSYWGIADLGSVVHLFPGRYRHAVLDLIEPKVSFHKLKCGNGYSYDDYMEWKRNIARKNVFGSIIYERDPDYLEEFIELI